MKEPRRAHENCPWDLFFKLARHTYVSSDRSELNVPFEIWTTRRTHASGLKGVTQGKEKLDMVMFYVKGKIHSDHSVSGKKKKEEEAKTKTTVESVDPNLYRAVTTGDINLLKRVLEIKAEALKSSQGNTILHVASSFGHLEVVQIIYQRFPDLLMMTNSKGDTALHSAARDGHLMVVEYLIDCAAKGADAETGNTKQVLLRIKNLEGNTALHKATRKRHQTVARVLIEADRELPNLVNDLGESAFYLAAELGLYEVVRELLELPIDHTLPLPESQQRMTALHAAILEKHSGIVKILLEKKPVLLESRDSNGRSGLHYAAFLGSLDDVRCMLNTSKAHHCDHEGVFPIHMAAMNGHVKIIQELLVHFPDSRELLDNEARNSLHIAVLNNKENVVKYILRTPELGKLINECDSKGNTPLHLAAINSHPRVADILTCDKRIDIGIVNKEGLTAYEAGKRATSSFQKVLTGRVLKSANASLCERKLVFKENMQGVQKSTAENFVDRINALVLAATLIVTLTFAAGLTMPGGDSNKGTPDMLTEGIRYVFVISNAIAMYSSIITVVTLLWAYIGDLNLLGFALKWSMRMLAIALTMVAVAFAAGVNLVVSKLGGLPIVVLVMSCLFLLCILVLFFPLLVPLLPDNCCVRLVSNICYRFLLFTSRYELRPLLNE